MTDLDVALMREVLEQLIAKHNDDIASAIAHFDTSIVWSRASVEAYRTCLALIDRTCAQVPVEAVA